MLITTMWRLHPPNLMKAGGIVACTYKEHHTSVSNTEHRAVVLSWAEVTLLPSNKMEEEELLGKQALGMLFNLYWYYGPSFPLLLMPWCLDVSNTGSPGEVNTASGRKKKKNQIPVDFSFESWIVSRVWLRAYLYYCQASLGSKQSFWES